MEAVACLDNLCRTSINSQWLQCRTLDRKIGHLKKALVWKQHLLVLSLRNGQHLMAVRMTHIPSRYIHLVIKHSLMKLHVYISDGEMTAL